MYEIIRAAIYERRHHFTNVDQLNKLLGLIRLKAAGRDHVDEFARRIRAWVVANGGRVNADWWESMDSWTVRSLDLAIEEAECAARGSRPSARRRPRPLANAAT